MIQLLKNKKTWLQNSDNHLEDQLVDAGAATQKKIQVSTEKKDQIQKTMQGDGDWYFHQVSGTFTFELFSY